MSLLPPIPTNFRAATAADSADQARSAHRGPAAGARAFRRRIAATPETQQDLGAGGNTALLDHRDLPVERRAASRARAPGRQRSRGCRRPRASRRRRHAGGAPRRRSEAAAKGARPAARARDQAICQGQGRGRAAPAMGRVDAQQRHPGCILGAPESSGRHRGDREEGVPGRAHAVASRRRRQSGGHPAAAAAGGGQRCADREAASAAAAIARRLHLPRRNDPPAQRAAGSPPSGGGSKRGS